MTAIGVLKNGEGCASHDLTYCWNGGREMRSHEYMMGYRAAWKDAIEFLHSKAKTFRDPDPKAKAILDVAATDLGNAKGWNRPPFNPGKSEEQPSQTPKATP